MNNREPLIAVFIGTRGYGKTLWQNTKYVRYHVGIEEAIWLEKKNDYLFLL